MLNAIFRNGFTSLIGLLHFICSSAALLGMIPSAWMAVATAICGLLISVGFFGAADGNKTQPDNMTEHNLATQS